VACPEAAVQRVILAEETSGCKEGEYLGIAVEQLGACQPRQTWRFLVFLLTTPKNLG
jgi:hypothetical protein